VYAPPLIRHSLSGSVSPSWREASAYHSLIGADPSAFAWEWLRRTPAYRAVWETCRRDRKAIHEARRFGLEGLEDPAIAVPMARPVWSRAVMPNVLTAHVENIAAPRSERIDLRLLAPLVTILIGPDETEHLLFSDGRRFLRVDVVEGTLIGCPSSLTYLLKGLTRLAGPIASLDRLARLVRVGGFEGERPSATMRQHRWILELRVADALASGCDQQGIARVLFGGIIAERRWRTESPSYRRQVQRLVGEARSKLGAAPGSWFQR
jgi:hypothetical protein